MSTWGDGSTAARTAGVLEAELLDLPFIDLERPPYSIVGDGVEDDGPALQAAIDALSATTRPGGQIRIPDGANLGIGTMIEGASNIRLSGGAKETSELTKLGDIILFDLSGTATGAANHVRRCVFENLTLHGGNNALWTKPIMRAFYSDLHHFQNVDFKLNYGNAFRAVEFWDSTFFNCRFDNGGGVVGSGLPAVSLLGRDAASGFGLTTDNCNVLNFIACTWESNRAGALEILKNSGGENNQIRFTNCKWEQSDFVGTPIHVDTARSVHFLNCYAYMGGFGSGYSTATDFMRIAAMQDSSIIGLNFVAANTASLVRSVISAEGSCTATLDRIYCSTPAGLTEAIVKITGSNNSLDISPRVAYQLNGGSNDLIRGLSTAAINLRGTGSPESVYTASIGSTYIRTDGGAGTTLYVKESGTGNTGWVGK